MAPVPEAAALQQAALAPEEKQKQHGKWAQGMQTVNPLKYATKFAKGGVSHGEKLAIGFRDFVLRGNVVDLAVAVVVGGAFNDLVKSFTSSFITPLIAAIWGGADFSQLFFIIHYSKFTYGAFINSAITFLIICAVLYFIVVVPMTSMTNKFFPKVPKNTCKECLEEIHKGARRCPHCTSDVPPEPPKTAEEEQEELLAAQRAPPGALQRNAVDPEATSRIASRMPSKTGPQGMARTSATRRPAAGAATGVGAGAGAGPGAGAGARAAPVAESAPLKGEHNV